MLVCARRLPAVLVVYSALVSSAAARDARAATVAPDRYCLSCLCMASSECNMDTECRFISGRSFCGPFYMTEHFWHDSNVTALAQFRNYDYQACSRDAACAGEAVTRYLSKHAADCDGDGRITCKDFGLMHLLGYRECQDPEQRRRAESTRFVARFVKCLLDTLALLEAGENVRPGCVPRTLASLWQAPAVDASSMPLM